MNESIVNYLWILYNSKINKRIRLKNPEMIVREKLVKDLKH